MSTGETWLLSGPLLLELGLESEEECSIGCPMCGLSCLPRIAVPLSGEKESSLLEATLGGPPGIGSFMVTPANPIFGLGPPTIRPGLLACLTIGGPDFAATRLGKACNGRKPDTMLCIGRGPEFIMGDLRFGVLK